MRTGHNQMKLSKNSNQQTHKSSWRAEINKPLTETIHVKVWVRYFLFFQQIITLHKHENFLYFIWKNSLRFRAIKFLYFLFLPIHNFSDSKGQSGIVYDAMNWFVWTSRCKFSNNPKTTLYYIINFG